MAANYSYSRIFTVTFRVKLLHALHLLRKKSVTIAKMGCYTSLFCDSAIILLLQYSFPKGQSYSTLEVYQHCSL